ncbi:MAG: hypothetical protein LLF82_001029 [Dehalococcoides mccartyi]|jgi:hypothetical protein|uniref:hypothetical protein n=1 Tax=Dehalococcoides mccartyi TaxID=61435 RepID=UPI002431AC60|nr:hypothetical protein [Dehalococcoides mccartyi]MCF7635544.1 hypothetical protein [Dehalococcoides mccartyi]
MLLDEISVLINLFVAIGTGALAFATFYSIGKLDKANRSEKEYRILTENIESLTKIAKFLMRFGDHINDIDRTLSLNKPPFKQEGALNKERKVSMAKIDRIVKESDKIFTGIYDFRVDIIYLTYHLNNFGCSSSEFVEAKKEFMQANSIFEDAIEKVAKANGNEVHTAINYLNKSDSIYVLNSKIYQLLEICIKMKTNSQIISHLSLNPK